MFLQNSVKVWQKNKNIIHNTYHSTLKIQTRDLGVQCVPCVVYVGGISAAGGFMRQSLVLLR